MVMDLQSRLQKKIDAICEGYGLHLIELQLKGGKSNTVIQVYADTKNGITLDQCEHLNRQIQDSLDMDESFTRFYRLDVSSPGLDRPLVKDFQFEKYLNKELIFQVNIGGQSVEKTAVLKSFDERKFEIEIKGLIENIDRINVEKVKVKIPW
jgi:ribosome maturation factor RimP